MPGLDALQKRTLEHSMQGAGLTRRQAMTAVAVVHAAMQAGELVAHDSLVSGVLGWWRAGAKVKAKHQPPARGGHGHVCQCAGACGAACQCATSASQSHSASQGQPASEAR